MTREQFDRVWADWLTGYKFTRGPRDYLWRRVRWASETHFRRAVETICAGLDAKWKEAPSLGVIVQSLPLWAARRDAKSRYSDVMDHDPHATPTEKARAIATWMNWRQDHGEVIDPAERQEMGALYLRYRDEARDAEKSEEA